MSKDLNNLHPVFIKISPENIVYFKALLESYEGFIGVMRTLNRLTGEIVVLGVEETKEDLMQFLNSIQQELEFYIIPTPVGLSEESLLNDAIY